MPDYIKVTDGELDQYPYTVGDLRRDNPNTSFPKRPSSETLAQWGVYPVTRTDRPLIDHTKSFREGDPVFSNGTWTQVWEVFDATQEEIAERVEGQAQHARNLRGELLQETDWLTMRSSDTGTPVPAAWHTYRQALRDITSHANWPHLDEADWPTKP